MEATINNKMAIRKKTLTLLSISLFFLVLDRQWGFFYSNTVFASNLLFYSALILLATFFSIVGVRYSFGRWSRLSGIWAPYMIYTIMGCLFQLYFQYFIYWFCCLVMVLIAERSSFIKALPLKLLLYGGVFALIGVYFQLCYASYYNAYISPLFIQKETISLWTEGFGMNGFTYQLGMTSTILLYGEITLLCFHGSNIFRNKKKQLFYYILLILFVVGVFLTGKRVASLLALILPFMVYFISNKNKIGKYIAIIFSVFFLYYMFSLFVDNISGLEDSRLFHRFANSYIEMQTGGDITSGRTYYYDLAYKAFEEHPILGVGVGGFISYTGADTDVHNTYLQVLCEQGIIGFVFYLIPIIYCLLYTIRLFPNVQNMEHYRYLKMSLAIQLTYIFSGLTGNENIGFGFIIYFIAIATLIYVDSARRQIMIRVK